MKDETRHQPPLDLLVVGAGPTGIAIGAEARQAGLEVLLVDRGPLCAAIVNFPNDMMFFTTRDLLEIADVPFTIPDPKPTRRQALAYYQGVARRYELPLALHEDVERVERQQDGIFTVHGSREGRPLARRAWAVALATGYFDQPRTLGVPGEDQPWVHQRYREPYAHFGQRVVVIGGGNSAAETALDLCRNGVDVTIIHRGSELKPSIKYWLRPDAENRIAEGVIKASFNSVVKRFTAREVVIEHQGSEARLAADAAYVLIGYAPDADFERRCGVAIEAETLIPNFDPETCESNVPRLYVAGTLQAGRRTDRIFIENSRGDSRKIVDHLLRLRTSKASRAMSSSRR